ncbi:MAG: T9SS type A sorting domain-containing protein [Bacteroidales bacterium]
MTLPASQRSHNAASFYKSGEGSFLPPQQLLVSVEQESKADKTIIGFIDDATDGYDGNYDATHLEGDEEAHSLYSMIGGTKYALNHLPSIEEHTIVPLGFEASTAGEFTLTSEWMESFSDDIPIYLEDIKDSYFQDLRFNPTYVFTSEPGDALHRFNIHFANPLDVEDNELAKKIHIYAYQKTIHVNLPESVQGDIYVYNLLGEEVTQRQNGTGMVEIPVNASNSYFIVKVISDGGIASEKVLIK